MTDAAAPPDQASRSRWSLWYALKDPNGYLLLLLLTVGQLVIWVLVLDRNIAIHVLAYWLLVTTMIVAFHRARVHPVFFRVVLATLMGLGVFLTVTAFFASSRATGDNETAIGWMALVYAAMLAVTFPLIVRRAFAHRIVSINTVCAMLSAYLFIGLFFAALVRAVGAFSRTFYVERATNNIANAVYFSFEALTTLGMGDLTPVAGIARVITIACALAGQLFLVTAVARTVSLFGQEQQGNLLTDDPES